MKRRLDRRGIGWFIGITFGLAWAIAAPLWLTRQGLDAPWAVLILGAMMFAPAIATLLVAYRISPVPDKRVRLGLGLGDHPRRWVWYWLFAWCVIPAFAVAAPFVGAMLGLYQMDVRDFSGLRAAIEKTPAASTILTMFTPRVLAFVQLLMLPLAPLLNSPFAFGEELGWRGYLLPQLLPLGQWRALMLSGIVWGIWHAPVIALGYNYPTHRIIGPFLMVVFCVIFGTLLGWTRLATGSVWPAVIAHGAVNGSAGAIFLFSKAGSEFDTAQVGLTGWTGWLLPLLWVTALVVARRLPVPDPPDSHGSNREVTSGVAPDSSEAVGETEAS